MVAEGPAAPGVVRGGGTGDAYAESDGSDGDGDGGVRVRLDTVTLGGTVEGSVGRGDESDGRHDSSCSWPSAGP